MSNEDVFGKTVGKGNYELRGPELSYLPFGKEALKAVAAGYDLSPEQTQKIWIWYSDQAGQAWDKYRLSQGDIAPITRETLNSTAFDEDRTRWHDFAKSIGINRGVANGLFSEYEEQMTGLVEQHLTAQEEAAAEAEAQEEAKQAEPGALPKEQAQLLLRKILSDPTNPYNDDKATPADHDLAVAGVNRLYGIINGTETKVSGYAEEHLARKEQELKEAYGIGGSLYKSGDYHSAYNPERPAEPKPNEDPGDKNDMAAEQLSDSYDEGDEGEVEGYEDL